ncbi:Pentatricopeptide repeat-containing protein At2g20710, mitochondrial [Linum grandiflorum]
MKLISGKFPLLSPHNHRIKFDFSHIISASFYSTEPDSPTVSPSSLLYRRIERIRDPKAPITPLLDQWVEEGNQPGEQLRFLVARMKSFRRYHHALQISNWISARSYLPVTTQDVATKLDLIYRVHGLVEAEKYFNNLSNKVKWGCVYGCLLNIYVQEKCVEKAEALIEEMKEKGIAIFSYPYNLLINLYCKVRDFERIDSLLEEMRINNIPHDRFTMNNLVAAYAAEPNIPRMEEMISKIEKDHLDSVKSWSLYTSAANGYTKVGSMDKALALLKKAEGMMPTHGRTAAVEFLLTLYSKVGDRDEVYRVWNAYKPSREPFANQYGCMISSLSKLDDLEGAEKVYEDFVSRCSVVDFRVVNRMLVAYCRRGLIEKAESFVENAAAGKVSYASTWQILATGYLNGGRMEEAVEMLKRALAIGRRDWVPNASVLDPCMEYLEKKRDAEGMEEIAKLLKGVEYSGDLYRRLVRTYIAAKQSGDGFQEDSVTSSEATTA